MKARNTMGDHAWAYASEKIAQLPDGAMSMGIGLDLERQSGLSPQDLATQLAPLVDQMIDGGANMIDLTWPTGITIRAYVRKRGKAVDIGSRKDFIELGWQPIVDELDAQAR